MSELAPRLPQWWNDHIAAAWSRASAAALSDWHIYGRTSLPQSIVEHALAFGHGGRMAYPSLLAWNTVSPPLRADWVRLGNLGSAAWDRVAEIIEHEWKRAAGPDGDAAPERPELATQS